MLAALADPTRRELLETLVDLGEATATSLAVGRSVTRKRLAEDA